MSGTWSRRRRSTQASSVPPSMSRSSTALLVNSPSNYSNTSSNGSNNPVICSSEHYSIFGQDGPVPMAPAMQYQYALLCRSTEKMFEEAEQSGVLSLAGRKLKEYPSSLVHKYDLADVVAVDLSNNRLPEIPGDLCELRSLESLRAKNNAIRRIPSDIALLDSLNYLDLSNNLLTSLPLTLFELPLELLMVAGNRLESIPREIRSLSGTLTELDLSHNMLKSIPADIALLKMLRVLLLRKNLLDQFPSELCRLSLHTLDLSSNQFVHLPLHIRKMKTLVEFHIDDNPLQSPPASIVNKGREHIFKWMDVAAGCAQPNHAPALKHHHSSSTLRALNLGRSVVISAEDRDMVRKAPAPIERRTRSTRFHTVGGSDSGYASTADEHRLSHELVPTSLDDITEYNVFSPSPDEGIQVHEEASCSTAESVSLNSQSSSSDEKITIKPIVRIEEPPKMRVVEATRTVLSPEKPATVNKATVPPLAKPEDDLTATTTTTPKKTVTALMHISNGAPITPIVVNNRTSSVTTNPPAPAPTTAVLKKQQSTDSMASSSGCSAKPQTSLASSDSPASLDVSNNNTPNAKDNRVSTPRPTVPPPGVPTAATTPVSKPISKVAPLVNTAAVNIKQSPPSSAAPTKTIKPASSISKLAQPSTASVRPTTKSAAKSAAANGTAAGTRKATPSSTNTSTRSRLPSSQSSSASVIRPTASTTSIPRSVRSTDSSKASTPSLNTSINSDKNGNATTRTPTTASSSSPQAGAKSTPSDERVSISQSSGLEGFRKIFKDKLGLALPTTRDAISEKLADGVHLCGLVNALKQRQYISPVATPTDSNPLTPMKARRNVDAFITACKRNGVPETQMCTTADILGRRNLPSVVKAIHCLVKNIPARAGTSIASVAASPAKPLAPLPAADPRVVAHV